MRKLYREIRIDSVKNEGQVEVTHKFCPIPTPLSELFRQARVYDPDLTRPHHRLQRTLDSTASFLKFYSYSEMSSNVGLSTPRGSGTSGYVQRNLAHLKPRDQGKPYSTDLDSLKHRQRQPDKEILEHDRKRDIEVKVFELRDRLEDEGYVLVYLFQNGVLIDRIASMKKKSRRRRRL